MYRGDGIHPIITIMVTAGDSYWNCMLLHAWTPSRPVTSYLPLQRADQNYWTPHLQGPKHW